MPATKSFVGVTRDRLGLDENSAIVFTDNVTLQGDGSLPNPVRLKQVEHDGTITGAGTVASPLSTTGASAAAAMSFVNANAGALPPGTPVFASAAGRGDKAKADAAATALAFGLVFANVASLATGLVVLRGPLTLTTAQWDAICGTVGGLAFGVQYFLSPATAGRLTSVAPVAAGQFVTPMVLGFSPTVGIVWPEYPVGL